jgi:hypothetical protein
VALDLADPQLAVEGRSAPARAGQYWHDDLPSHVPMCKPQSKPSVWTIISAGLITRVESLACRLTDRGRRREQFQEPFIWFRPL